MILVRRRKRQRTQFLFIIETHITHITATTTLLPFQHHNRYSSTNRTRTRDNEKATCTLYCKKCINDHYTDTFFCLANQLPAVPVLIIPQYFAKLSCCRCMNSYFWISGTIVVATRTTDTSKATNIALEKTKRQKKRKTRQNRASKVIISSVFLYFCTLEAPTTENSRPLFLKTHSYSPTCRHKEFFTCLQAAVRRC